MISGELKKVILKQIFKFYKSFVSEPGETPLDLSIPGNKDNNPRRRCLFQATRPLDLRNYKTVTASSHDDIAMFLENNPPGGGPGTYATRRTINMSAFAAPEENAMFLENNPPGGGPETYATNRTINVSAFVAPEGNATFLENNPPGGGPGTYATRRTINMSAFAAPEENAMSLENSPPGGGPGTYATNRTINVSAFVAPEGNETFLENNPPGGGPGSYATRRTINMSAFAAPEENAMFLENNPPGGGPETYATNRTINVSAFVAPEGNATFFETNPPGGGPGTYATRRTINMSAFAAPEENAMFLENNPPGGGPGTYATNSTINVSAFVAPDENAISLENNPTGGGPGKTKGEHRYSEEDVQTALEQIRIGLISIYQASIDFNIPRGTLQYRLSDKFKNKLTTGPPTVLTASEEVKLVEWLFDMQRKGFPLTSPGLQAKVADFIKASPRPNTFKDGSPGQSWLNGFMRRHPSIAIRTPEGVSAASARVSENDLRGWYRSVLAYGGLHPEILEALKDPTRKINGDEIGFYMYKLAKKVLAKKGSRDVMLVETGDPKKNITVLFCFSADGFCFPPDIILPYNRLPTDVIQSVPGPWGIGKSDNGWMDTPNFVLYIRKILYPTLVRRGVKFPVVFFVDGHKSHTAFAAADACAKLGIVLIAIYPNSTRIIQPADVGIFGPLKQSWRKIVQQRPPNDPLTTRNFAPSLQTAMNEALKEETIKKSFVITGIHPFDENAPNYSKCLAKSASGQQANGSSCVPSAAEHPSASSPNDSSVASTSFAPSPVQSFPRVHKHPSASSLNDSSVASTSFAPSPVQSFPRVHKRPSASNPNDSSMASYSFALSDQGFPSAAEHPSASSPNDSSVASTSFAPSPVQSFPRVHKRPSASNPNDSSMASYSFALSDQGFPSAAEHPSASSPNDSSVASTSFAPSPVQSFPRVHKRPSASNSNDSSMACSSFALSDQGFPSADEHPSASSPNDSGSSTGQLREILGDDTQIEIDLFELSDGLPCDSALPLQEVTNKRRVSITDFLQTPPTPKRKSKHINYKIKTNPILTASERLEELRQAEEEKANKIRQQQENARKREEVRLGKLAEKERREEARVVRQAEIQQREVERKRKREEKAEWKKLQETVKLRKIEEKRERKEAKKKAAQAPDDIFVRLR
ncbi:uncharacterized protein LOC120419773 isoform X2 [Culex pipiens pallens]|uniref:uncharacterized protein LOC120419773 isoform X2 n=1 Tax=Culex pipiens pallens TaxID=42434 RepID=UPI0019547605|nr:uncharacterized protein LOC120419773 isoform X2 [Culex pipiens pallens]